VREAVDSLLLALLSWAEIEPKTNLGIDASSPICYSELQHLFGI